VDSKPSKKKQLVDHWPVRTDLTRPRWVNELQSQPRWRWVSPHTHGTQTSGRPTSTRLSSTWGGVRQTTRDRVTRGGGADNTCPCQWGGEQATSQTHTPTHHTYNQGTHWYAQTSHHPHTNNLSKNNLMCHSYSFQRRVELAQGWIFPSRMWVPNLGTLLTIALDSLTHFLSSRVEFLLKTDSGYPKDKGGYFIRPGNLWKSPSL